MVHSIYQRPKPAHTFVQGLTPEGEGWRENIVTLGPGVRLDVRFL